MKYLFLLSIVLALGSCSSADNESKKVASSRLRRGDAEVQGERRLFSFSSLYYHLHPHRSSSGGSGSGSGSGSGASSSSGSSGYTGSGSSSGGSGSDGGSNGYSASGGGDGNWVSQNNYEEAGNPNGGGNGGGNGAGVGGSNGNSQSAQRFSNLAAYIIGAAAVVGGVVAIIYNKPKTDTEPAEQGIVLDDGTILSVMSGINNLGDQSVVGDATTATFDSNSVFQNGRNRLWAMGAGAMGGLAALGGAIGLTRNDDSEEAGDFVELEEVHVPGPVISPKGYAI